MIRELRVSDPDPERLAALPGIAVYIAREGDSLWTSEGAIMFRSPGSGRSMS